MRFEEDGTGNVIEYVVEGEDEPRHESLSALDNIVGYIQKGSHEAEQGEGSQPKQGEGLQLESPEEEQPNQSEGNDTEQGDLKAATPDNAAPDNTTSNNATPDNATSSNAAPDNATPTEESAEFVMPMREDGEPDFMATTPQQGHKYLYEEAGLSREEASQFVEANIEAAEKELKRVQGKAPKIGTSLTKYQQEKAKHQQQLDEAQRVLDYWKGVKAEQQRVAMAEARAKAERDAAAHEAAVAAEKQRQAEELAKQQEQAEAEEEGKNGIEDVDAFIDEMGSVDEWYRREIAKGPKVGPDGKAMPNPDYMAAHDAYFALGDRVYNAVSGLSTNDLLRIHKEAKERGMHAIEAHVEGELLKRKNEVQEQRAGEEEEQKAAKENVQGGESEKERKARERKEREQRRKQKILAEGTTFDEYFGLTPVSETMTSEEIGANVRRIVEGLKANEGNNDLFKGYAYKGNYKKNAGHQVEDYLTELEGVVPSETLRQWAESEGLDTYDDVRAFGERLYAESITKKEDSSGMAVVNPSVELSEREPATQQSKNGKEREVYVVQVSPESGRMMYFVLRGTTSQQSNRKEFEAARADGKRTTSDAEIADMKAEYEYQQLIKKFGGAVANNIDAAIADAEARVVEADAANPNRERNGLYDMNLRDLKRMKELGEDRKRWKRISDAFMAHSDYAEGIGEEQARATNGEVAAENAEPTEGQALSLDTYVAGMTKLQRGRVEKVLNQRVDYREGGPMTRAEHIERLVANGAEFGKHVGNNGKVEYGIEEGNDSYTIISKMEYDYAAYLGGKLVPEKVFEDERERLFISNIMRKHDYPDIDKIKRLIGQKERELRVFNPNTKEGKEMQQDLEDLRKLLAYKEKEEGGEMQEQRTDEEQARPEGRDTEQPSGRDTEQPEEREQRAGEASPMGGEKIEVSGKSKKKDLKKHVDSFTLHEKSKQNVRVKGYPLEGVYYDEEGYGVATDIHVLVASKQLYDPSKKGQIVAKHKVMGPGRGSFVVYEKGEVIEGKYPNWRGAVPSAEGWQKTAVDMQRLADFAAQALATRKEVEKKAPRWFVKTDLQKSSVALHTPDGKVLYYDAELLEKFAQAAMYIGATEVEYDHEARPLVARSKDGVVVLMPLAVGDELLMKHHYDMKSGEVSCEKGSVYEELEAVGMKEQKAGAEVAAVSGKEAELRDALVETMRKEAGMEVSMDVEEGQAVLDEVNGRADAMSRGKMSEKQQEREQSNYNLDYATASETGKTLSEARRERVEREEKRREAAKEVYEIILSGEYNDVTLQKISDYIDDVTP